jgi:hypothetical protein
MAILTVLAAIEAAGYFEIGLRPSDVDEGDGMGRSSGVSQQKRILTASDS